MPLCNGRFQGNFGGICTHSIRAEKNIVFRISYAAGWGFLWPLPLFFVTREEQVLCLVLIFCCKSDPKAMSGEPCWTTRTQSLLKLPGEEGHISLDQVPGLPQSLLIHMRAGCVHQRQLVPTRSPKYSQGNRHNHLVMSWKHRASRR